MPKGWVNVSYDFESNYIGKYVETTVWNQGLEPIRIMMKVHYEGGQVDYRSATISPSASYSLGFCYLAGACKTDVPAVEYVAWREQNFISNGPDGMACQRAIKAFASATR